MFEAHVDYKMCSRCHQMTPKAEFHKNKARSDQLDQFCKVCRKSYLLNYHGSQEALREYHNAARRKSYKKHQAKEQKRGREYYQNLAPEQKAIYKRQRALLPYAMTQEQYDSLLSSQHGCCALCGTHEPGGNGNKSFAIDHDHQTDQVRGLLCNVCNVWLGGYENLLDRVDQKVILKYLRESGRVRNRKTPLGATTQPNPKRKANE
jgi:Recombination endonuclease VII